MLENKLRWNGWLYFQRTIPRTPCLGILALSTYLKRYRGFNTSNIELKLWLFVIIFNLLTYQIHCWTVMLKKTCLYFFLVHTETEIHEFGINCNHTAANASNTRSANCVPWYLAIWKYHCEKKVQFLHFKLFSFVKARAREKKSKTLKLFLKWFSTSFISLVRGSFLARLSSVLRGHGSSPLMKQQPCHHKCLCLKRQTSCMFFNILWPTEHCMTCVWRAQCGTLFYFFLFCVTEHTLWLFLSSAIKRYHTYEL